MVFVMENDRALASLSATSFAVCLNCGFSAFSILRRPSLQSSWLLLRAGTVELFAVPPVVHVLLLLKRFLDGLHLVFQLGRFQFLCGFPRHLLYRSNLAPM